MFEPKNFLTLNINISCTTKNGALFVIVEGMKPMSLDDFAYWLHSAARTDRNIERTRLTLPEVKEFPREATRESRPITYDTKESPMPTERKTYESRIRAQIAKLRRKHPNASTEELRAAAERIERSIEEALSGLDFSDLALQGEEPQGEEPQDEVSQIPDSI